MAARASNKKYPSKERRAKLGLRLIAVELESSDYEGLVRIMEKQRWTKRTAVEESIRLMMHRLNLVES